MVFSQGRLYFLESRALLAVCLHAGEIALYNAVEAIENREDKYECGSAYGHAGRAYRRDDVYPIVRFLCEKIAASYVQGQSHFFRSSSICSA